VSSSFIWRALKIDNHISSSKQIGPVDEPRWPGVSRNGERDASRRMIAGSNIHCLKRRLAAVRCCVVCVGTASLVDQRRIEWINVQYG